MRLENFSYEQQDKDLSLDEDFLASQKEELWRLRDDIEFNDLIQRDWVSLDEDVDLKSLQEEFKPKNGKYNFEYKFVA